MRYIEFARTLVEKAPNNAALSQAVDRASVAAALEQAGYEVKVTGNKLGILTDEQRETVLKDALAFLQKTFPTNGVEYSSDPKSTGSSIGGIKFRGSPVVVLARPKSKQGGGSSGKLNEENLRAMLQMLIMDYGSVNVMFVDKRGKKIGIKDCTKVDDASMNVVDRQKADLILTSSDGKSLPISLKKVQADMWESADSTFGEKAKAILAKLQKQGVVQLQKFKTDKGGYFKLTKEIVVEPTAEEAMGAIFGSDLFKRGAVVVQTFKDEHFAIRDNNITIQCEYIFTTKEDIPTSHLMVWIIRNDKTRNNPLPGLRTLGVTLARGIGKSGTKDAILVDVNGNVVQNPNIKP
jgi:hypothetical protein